jgi:hypothetical protein
VTIELVFKSRPFHTFLRSSSSAEFRLVILSCPGIRD